MRRALRIATITLACLVCLLGIAAWLSLRASLPRRSGMADIPGLLAPVALEFDARGIPRIRADSLGDAYAAQGFVHAQDRFFQMDLSRRSAAGELAALVGAAAVDFDASRRPAQLRRRAAAALANLPQRHREYIRRYTQGVNAGLADLGMRPPEYLLLRQRPQPWLPEDSLLVVLALYTMMSNNDTYEQHNGALRELLPDEAFAFFTPMTARDDRPIAARASADLTGGYRPEPIPGPGSIDLRGSTYDGSLNFIRQPLSPGGSNNWALVGGAVGPQAMVANDPHLALRIPNVFHRAELYWGERVLRGVGIAGLPGILLGAGGSLAWGATVSYADQADLVVVEPDASDPSRYLTATGAEDFGIETQFIDVAGRASPVSVEVRTTRWGPVVAHDHAGRPLALRAKWLDPDGFDLGLLDLAEADTTADAIAIMHAWRGPSLSWVAADAAGNIGWTVNGPVPQRRNFDGSVPERWGTGEFGWRGELLLPWTIGSGEDSLYSANNRQLTMPYARALSRFSLPPRRARAIAEALDSQRITDERSSLALQLDTRADMYDMLRDVVLSSIPATTTDPVLAQARALLGEWNGYAERDSLAMPVLERFYDQLLERVIGAALQRVRAADPQFVYRWPLADEVLRRILEERPGHFLPAGFTDWDAWLAAILRDSLPANAGTQTQQPVQQQQVHQQQQVQQQHWGAVNRLAVAHPLGSVPGLGAWLNWPQLEQPGNTHTLRVAQSNFGAVIRMNVRPGEPASGILQLAGGQSGHFLSPHYADQLDEWSNGTPTPFLAGPAQHRYTLRPAAREVAAQSAAD